MVHEKSPNLKKNNCSLFFLKLALVKVANLHKKEIKVNKTKYYFVFIFYESLKANYIPCCVFYTKEGNRQF